MSRRSARSLSRSFAALMAVGLATFWGPSALAAVGASPATSTLTSCSFSALKSAVKAGGTVDYGTSCQSTPVSFTSTITLASIHRVNRDSPGRVNAKGAL